MKELEYPFDSNLIRQKRKQLKKELLKKGDFITRKIALLSGSTIGEMKPILELFLLNQGISPVFYEGHYNRYYEEVLFDCESLMEFKPDYIYIHTTVRNLSPLPDMGDSKEEVDTLLKNCFGHFEKLWSAIREQIGCPVIQNNFEMLPWRIMGNMDCVSENGAVNFIERLNGKFAEYARAKDGFYINDIHYLSASYGLEKWFDLTGWYAFKLAFAQDAVPLVCQSIGNIIKSLCGKNKKAVVVDLDNTLWGGVIGDDGVEGIKLGSESAEGMPYAELQAYLKKLSKLGIALAICSKNEINTALEGFSHPASILGKEDFTAIYANWEEKSINIERIAREINILPESLVFADDNPAEREQVESAVKGVAVLPLDSPENYVRLLDKSGYFEVTRISGEDLRRKEYYRANREREEEQKSYESYGEYLLGLKMAAEIKEMAEQSIGRVTQLIQKTNQFNLTGIRYTEEEVRKFRQGNIILCGSLTDKFGENGIVSVIMAKVSEGEAEILLWIMSCRVFKREMEAAMFDELVSACKRRELERISGFYRKTAKNRLVENFYQELGFASVGKENEESQWSYRIPGDYEKKNKVIDVNGEMSRESKEADNGGRSI